MMAGLQSGLEKLLVGLTAILFATGCGWWWRQQGDVHRLRTLPLAVALSGAPHVPGRLPKSAPGIAPWPKAAAQSRGPGWRYELFTPPAIHYNPLARCFAVTLPESPVAAAAGSDLELVDVRQELYRLQLEGYCGVPGDYLAAFTSPESTATLLARAGRRFDELGLTLRSIAVNKVPAGQDGTGPGYEFAAQAVLADEQTGGEVVLDSRTRKFTGAPLALLQTPAGGAPRTVREGDTFGEAGSTYRVERIQLDPPEVVVARTVPGLPQPERRILRTAARPGGLAGPPRGPAQPAPVRPAQALAVRDR